jgi:hypothetical protein
MFTKCLILMFTLGLFSSCASYKREISFSETGKKSEVVQMLYYASLAGSSHNSQPWKVEAFGNDSLQVFADKSRQLTVIDPQGRELYISLGAFIENLNIAAAGLGYQTEIAVNNNETNGMLPVATIRLSKSKNERDNEALKEIELRCTSRIPFDTSAINVSDLITLISIDTRNIHFLPATSVKGKFVKQKALEAYTQQARNKEAQDELAGWIRFSNKDAKEKKDGLTTAGMGIKGIGGFFVRNFLKPDDSKSASFIEKGVEKTKLQVENCGGWIIITQEGNSIESYINAGRLYERLNLKCRKMKLGFHPMFQIIEEKNFEVEANKVLGYQGRIMFVARIGYVTDYPDPVSVRKPVEGFTKFNLAN